MKKPSTKKLKRVWIEIQYREPVDFGLILNEIKHRVLNGEQLSEFKLDSANASFTHEFIEKSNYIETQINGVWCRIYESKMDSIQ